MRNISDIDPNLKVARAIDEPTVRWYSAADDKFKIYGLYEPYIYGQTKPVYRRMPDEVSKAVSPGVHGLSTNTAGGRIRFVTDSDYVAIHCECNAFCGMPHMPASASSGFDLYETENGKTTFRYSFVPPFASISETTAYESIYRFDEKKMHLVTINFPLYNGISALSIGLSDGAVAYRDNGYSASKLPVVFYGSSITQGACASKPGNSYESFISRALDVDYVNLGFSGNAKGEPAMAEYLAKLPMSAFVCDYDYNADSPEHLQATHYNLCKTVRSHNPTLPIICVSKANELIYPVTDKRREIIKDTVKRMQAEGDENIYFVNGADFYASQTFADCCTVDNAHPNDLGFHRMAEGLIPILSKVLGVSRTDV